MMSMDSRIAVPAVMTSSTIRTSPAQGAADDVAALTVVLGFLAIERKRHVAARVLRERRRGDGDQGNALVSGSEQHIELQPGGRHRRRVGASHRADGGAGVEQSGVEKVRTLAARFQRKAAESQNSRAARTIR